MSNLQSAVVLPTLFEDKNVDFEEFLKVDSCVRLSTLISAFLDSKRQLKVLIANG